MKCPKCKQQAEITHSRHSSLGRVGQCYDCEMIHINDAWITTAERESQARHADALESAAGIRHILDSVE